jgi:hypothetical protein
MMKKNQSCPGRRSVFAPVPEQLRLIQKPLDLKELKFEGRQAKVREGKHL